MQIFSCSTTNPTEKLIFENMIKEADKDGDKEVSLQEFILMMEKFVTKTSA